MAVIQNNLEKQEEYWAREVLWSVKKLKNKGLPLTFTNIQRIINIRKANFKQCLPYLNTDYY